MQILDSHFDSVLIVVAAKIGSESFGNISTNQPWSHFLWLRALIDLVFLNLNIAMPNFTAHKNQPEILAKLDFPGCELVLVLKAKIAGLLQMQFKSGYNSLSSHCFGTSKGIDASCGRSFLLAKYNFLFGNTYL